MSDVFSVHSNRSNKTDLTSCSSAVKPPIIDIRKPNHTITLKEQIVNGLSDEDNRSLPTMLFYNADGLKLFEEITTLEEYYLTQNEIDVFRDHSKMIVEQFPEGIQLIELGSGGLSKIRILLDEFERQKKRCHYFALDLDASELERSFNGIDVEAYDYVRFSCLHGTYDDGLRWLKDPMNREGPMCVMSIGSTLGNFSAAEACEFLRMWAANLRPDDKMLIGLDSCDDEKKVYRAYNDSANVTREFYMNALTHANAILGSDVFHRNDWELSTRYNAKECSHEAYLVAKIDFRYENITVPRGARVFIEQSKKYPNFSYLRLWADSGLVAKAQFGNRDSDYFVHVLEPAHISFSDKPEHYLSRPLPTLQEFEDLWHVWDLVTLSVVPPEALQTKPIDLRHDLVFYLGHIPTFSDIQISRVTQTKGTEPVYFWNIFERGIDPDVDDPTQCHSHSEVPDEWPCLQAILQHRNQVRSRIRGLLISKEAIANPKISRALWIGFEHEAMHLETFIYMLVQSDDIRGTRTIPDPNFEKLAKDAARNSRPATWYEVPAQTVALGMDMPPLDKIPPVTYGWDNEMPKRLVETRKFMAQSRPITNREYAYRLQTNATKLTPPASWVSKKSDDNGISENDAKCYGLDSTIDDARKQPSFESIKQWQVRTILGKIPLLYALDWPVMASYNQLEAYAKIERCRIPTHAEAKAIYQLSAGLRRDKQWSSNANGKASAPARLPLLVDLSPANVGFKNWHPTSVADDDELHGHADFGGLWEWTSSELERHDGFEAMPDYPNYTADFFDGKHNIVLGGSWATHPRIAGRTSLSTPGNIKAKMVAETITTISPTTGKGIITRKGATPEEMLAAARAAQAAFH
ncbi:U3 snoRNP protein [Ascosphaera pollenicola]|nr:U3 snoRNP protein [Ascosphaera pollenicola]